MHPSHFISSAQINLISVNEYAQTRNPAGHDIIKLPKGTPSLLIAFSPTTCLVLFSHSCVVYTFENSVEGVFFLFLFFKVICVVLTKQQMTQADSIVVLDKYELSR